MNERLGMDNVCALVTREPSSLSAPMILRDAVQLVAERRPDADVVEIRFYDGEIWPEDLVLQLYEEATETIL